MAAAGPKEGPAAGDFLEIGGIPGRGHAAAGDELEGHHAVDGGALALKAGQQQVHALFSQALGVLVDGGQPGHGKLAQGDAVVAHHGWGTARPPGASGTGR